MWGVTLITSSPRYPRSNGKAEAGVKIVKSIISKCSTSSEILKGLLAYREAKLHCGYSPAQLFLGRQVRGMLPKLPEQLQPQWPNLPELRQRQLEVARRAKEHHDLVTRAKLLMPLSQGNRVFVTDLATCGVISGEADEPRSYWVSVSGRRYRRNRSALIWAPTAANLERPGWHH
ncbi:hypothetical protein KUF71_020746 [Frankliniella fusca]|uniref:Integrase catalytic domain-containing protein n=1 Tax=Frankliniella fusca TaxID=407009 RepID=A0AAE1GXW4_9NEOP|nr:hypothetical protein KUF71_020746 [Frankliniella fusca]